MSDAPADVRSPPDDDWYRQVLETAPDAMIIVGRDERILFVNLQVERLFGYARAALIGKKLDTLIPERLRRGHSGHMARFFSQPGTRPMGSGLELFGRRADGSELAIEVSLSPVRGNEGPVVSAAIRDISERKRAETAAKLAADRLASAVENVQEAIALFDAEDKLVLCNSVYRRMVGDFVSGPLIGRSRTDFLEDTLNSLVFQSDEEKERFRTARLAKLKDKQSSYDVRRKDGRSFRVIDRVTMDGGLVRTVWDLTDDMSIQEELQSARAAAEAASAAKSEFLSSMSHELRTPLNAILGFAQLLKRDKKAPLSERHVERVSQILKGGEHLLRLIDDILDLSRIEAGGISLSTEAVRVDEVLEEVKTTLEPMATRHGLSLTVESPGAILVSADRVRFAQILMNFGSNAIKYNRPGGDVRFEVETRASGSVRITVRDTGLGIPDDKQSKLFQPFQRAGQETGPIEGTGIGLVITRRLAELMDGGVGFQSVAGAGSSFWLDLPVHATPALPVAHPTRPSREPRLNAENRRVVLYVEDNPANVLFMRDLIDGFDGIDIITAPTAEIGIELAKAKVPDLIIMDINLPGISGLEALGQLRAAQETAAIPVIALTAAASERDKQHGEAAGFYRYLTKPVRVDELETALETLFGNVG